MRICDEHRLNDARRNDEPCIYCQRNALLLQKNDIALAWAEQKAARAANGPSGEFREDELRAERVSLAKKSLEALLDRIEVPMTVKRKCPKCGFGEHDGGTSGCSMVSSGLGQ